MRLLAVKNGFRRSGNGIETKTTVRKCGADPPKKESGPKLQRCHFRIWLCAITANLSCSCSQLGMSISHTRSQCLGVAMTPPTGTSLRRFDMMSGNGGGMFGSCFVGVFSVAVFLCSKVADSVDFVMRIPCAAIVGTVRLIILHNLHGTREALSVISAAPRCWRN